MIVALVDTAKALRRCAICGEYIGYTLNKNRHFNGLFCCKECAMTDEGKKLQVARFNEKNPINPMHRPEVKEKLRQSYIAKYGVDNPSRVKEFQEKRKQTCIERFGVDNIFKYEGFIDEMSDRKRGLMFDNMVDILAKRNIEPLFTVEDVYGLKREDKKRVCFRCKECGSEFSREFFNYFSVYCPCCARGGCGSKGEKELVDFLTELGFVLDLRNRSILDGYEVDIVVPEKKLCIEFDGLHWHSSARGKDENYHLWKTEVCEGLGYKMVHIFEDEWVYERESIKEVMKKVLGVTPNGIEGDVIEVDRRFWCQADFSEYVVLEVRKPRLFYTKNFDRVSEYREGYNKIWDCGTLVLKKKK